ncbi:hypothetical protein ACHWQZ_G018637 [Mnemiopsis leidyi]
MFSLGERAVFSILVCVICSAPCSQHPAANSVICGPEAAYKPDSKEPERIEEVRTKRSEAEQQLLNDNDLRLMVGRSEELMISQNFAYGNSQDTEQNLAYGDSEESLHGK